jgi:hypothetical protein
MRYDLMPGQSNRIMRKRRPWPFLREGCLHYSTLTDFEMVREFLGAKQHLFCRFDYLDNGGGNGHAAIPVSVGGINVQSPDRLDPLIREHFQRQVFIR